MTAIKRLRRKDLTSCAKLYVRAFNGKPWNDKWTIATALQRLNDIQDTPGFYGLKLLQGDRIIAAMHGNVESWYHRFHFNLKEMYVDPKHQRSGIGTLLLTRMRNDLKERGVIGVYLFTSSKKGISTFYQKNGYKILKDMIMMSSRI